MSEYKTYDGTPVNEDDLLYVTVVQQNYEDMLDEVYGTVEIAGMTYGTARVLQEVDPIAYRCGLADYTDERYEAVYDEDGYQIDYYVEREDVSTLCDSLRGLADGEGPLGRARYRTH